MHCIGGFQVLHSPRYLIGEEEAKAHNAALQTALWNAINFVVTLQLGYTIELRLVSKADDRVVEPYLLFWSESDPNAIAPVSALLGLLPTQYGWRELSAQDAVSVTRLHGAWHAVRSVRRLDFVELPSHASLAYGGRLHDALGTNESRVNQTSISSQVESGEPSSNSSSSIVGHVARGFQRRQFPEVKHLYVPQRHWPNLCVPIVGEITENVSGEERLFEELLQRSPAVFSVALMMPKAEDLIEDRMVAARWRRFVEPLMHVIASTGIASVNQVRSVYDRYWLPRGHVTTLSMLCWAGSAEHAIAIAQAAAARCGGMRAFSISTPRQPRSITPAIRNPTVDPEGWENAYLLMERALKDAGIDMPDDEACLRFLHRLPHLYSLEEAWRLVQLPFTCKAGLPGLETKPVVPFSDATRGFRSRDYVPSRNEIRIGLSRCGNDQAHSLSKSRANWHVLHIDELAKHAFVTGSTGSGKSTFTKFLVAEIARAGVPVMVIEPVKGEYASAMRGFREVPALSDIVVTRRCLDGGTDGRESEEYLAFDPMRIPSGVSVARHVSYLKGCFQAAFPMEDAAALILENGLWSYYRQLGWGPFHRGKPGECRLVDYTRKLDPTHKSQGAIAPGDQPRLFRRLLDDGLLLLDADGNVEDRRKVVEPSFESFVGHFLLHSLPSDVNVVGAGEAASRADEWRQWFRRRFRNLMSGPLGVCFRRADDLVRRGDSLGEDPLAPLLASHVVVELEAIADEEQKSLVMAFLMTYLFERRQADGNASQIDGRRLRHVLVIEEAHRLLSNHNGSSRGGEASGLSASGKAVQLFTDMLAEIRSYGQGLVIVDQIPSKIAPEVLKNTNLKVMLRLNSADDREYLGAAMGFEPEHESFVGTLRAGEMVVFNAKLDQPVLLSVPEQSNWAGLVY